MCVGRRRTFADVCVRVGEAGRLSRLPPEQAPQVGPRLVRAPLVHRVTLRALGDEHLLPLGDVAHDWQPIACVDLAGKKENTNRFIFHIKPAKLAAGVRSQGEAVRA